MTGQKRRYKRSMKMMNFRRIALAVFAVAIIVFAAFLATEFFKVSGSGAANPQTGAATAPEEQTGTATTGTTTVDASKFSEIKEDMTKSQVVSLVGEPTDKQTITTPKGHVIEYWYYTASNNDVWQIGFSSDLVSVARKY